MRRLITLPVLAALSTLGLTAWGAAPAVDTGSAVPLLHTCDGTGTVVFGSGTPTLWTVDGSGVCYNSALPPQPVGTVTLHGGGTSSTLGPCTNSAIVVENLDLTVTVTYTDTVTGASASEVQTWSAPISTFPLITPFVLTTADNGFGAGVVITHIFLQCGNAGEQPSASFTWEQIDNGSAVPSPPSAP
jgi:hypothetical protein